MHKLFSEGDKLGSQIYHFVETSLGDDTSYCITVLVLKILLGYLPPCPLSNKIILTGKQKQCSVNCCWLELLLGRGRVLAPGRYCLLKSREAASLGEVRYDHPSHPSPLLQKPNIKKHCREVDRGQGPFPHCLSFQSLYGESSPDPRRTRPPFSFLVLPVVLGGFIWFFPLFSLMILQLLLGFSKVSQPIRGKSSE